MKRNEKVILLIFNSIVLLFVLATFFKFENLSNTAIVLLSCTVGLNIGRIIKKKRKINKKKVYITILINIIGLCFFIISYVKDSYFFLYSALILMLAGIYSFISILNSQKE